MFGLPKYISLKTICFKILLRSTIDEHLNNNPDTIYSICIRS